MDFGYLEKMKKYRLLGPVAGALFIFLMLVSIGVMWAAYQYFDRTPGELMRYAERRLIGHNKLEFVILPIFRALLPHIERPVTGPYPTFGKGAQAFSLPPQRYDAEGRPLANRSYSSDIVPVPTPHSIVDSVGQIAQAIAGARPGQVLEIAPGTYTFDGKIRVQNAGLATNPIVLRARVPGSVVIQFDTGVGFYVAAPYWIFENLVIRGIDQKGDHAFHVTGKAKALVLRNNRVEDFNAHIKVNGLNGDWPDFGLIQFNSLTNSRPRVTGLPVTLIDLVGANEWTVADNVISNFIKLEGNQISYGVFMKGDSHRGRIERNLIVCTESDISQRGTRVGLSFGGGGTGTEYCRDKRCITEHSEGTAANNIVANCNDFGVYVNKSNQTTIANNLLLNTYGIDVRFPESSATVYGNVVEGRIRARDGGTLTKEQNQTFWLGAPQTSLMALSFDWPGSRDLIPTAAQVQDDFCFRKREVESPRGPFSMAQWCR